jgi:Na+-driven multidrug efflux pump
LLFSIDPEPKDFPLSYLFTDSMRQHSTVVLFLFNWARIEAFLTYSVAKSSLNVGTGAILRPLPATGTEYRRVSSRVKESNMQDDILLLTENVDSYYLSLDMSMNSSIDGTSLTECLPSMPPNNLLTFNTNDDAINAILMASEEAVVAAEATLNAVVLPTSMESATQEYPTDVSSANVQASSTLAVDASSVAAPSVAKILLFAIPAIGVWLCNPLLSLIDTSAVGMLSGTIQQAALNPAVAVTDYSALLMAFMYTGTTNLIAAAQVQDRNDVAAPRTSRTLVGVLKLSTFVGLGIGLFLLVGASTLLRTLIGNDGISPAVFDAAMKYVRIRALGMPAAALIGSAQAACLGMQDIKSPLYVLLAAAVVNFAGDMLFVGSTHPWIGGAAGAAWSTVFSQYAAASMFVYWLRHKGLPKESRPSDTPSKSLNLSSAIFELTSSSVTLAHTSRRRRFVNAVRSFVSSKDEIATTETKTSRGFLEGKLRKRDLISFPSRRTLKDFAPFVIPVTLTVIGRLSGYVSMSHVVSSSLGTVSMAAQQVLVSLFYCLCPIADSLSLTAQSFFPAIFESDVGPNRSRAMKQTTTTFFKAGGVFGAAMVAAVRFIPLLSGFFTADPNVISLVNMVVPYLMGFFAVHGFVCATEGLLLGRKDLGFLGRMYAGFFGVVPLLMLRVKTAALLAKGNSIINLTSVWKIFVGYQLFRASAWSVRVLFLQRQTEKEAPLDQLVVSVTP